MLWDRPSVLERLKKRGIAVAKSFVVLRGDDKKRAQKTIQERQDMIESQSKATKNRGQFYIDKAKKEKEIVSAAQPQKAVIPRNLSSDEFIGDKTKQL